MPQERLTTPALHQTQCGASVRKIREILRLKWECKLSERAIALSCSTSRSTVADYLKRAEAAGLKWPLPENQSDHQLSELLHPKTQEPTLKAAACFQSFSGEEKQPSNSRIQPHFAAQRNNLRCNPSRGGATFDEKVSLIIN